MDKTPPMENVSAAEAGERWSELLARVGHNEVRLTIEGDGEPVAVVVSAKDYAFLSRTEARRKADFAIIEQMGEAFADVPDDELEREIALALDEVRAEKRERAARELAHST